MHIRKFTFSCIIYYRHILSRVIFSCRPPPLNGKTVEKKGKKEKRVKGKKRGKGIKVEKLSEASFPVYEKLPWNDKTTIEYIDCLMISHISS